MTEKNAVTSATGMSQREPTTRGSAIETPPLTPFSQPTPTNMDKPNGPSPPLVTTVESTSLVPQEIDVGIVTGVASLTPTSLSFRGDLPFAEWQEVGIQLRKIESGVNWWIGDWLRYGEHRYGETYAQAVEQTDLAYQTLANTVWVAGKIEPSRRREKLSFKHHAEVAALEPDEQDALLGEAEHRKWNSMELRRAVQTYKREKAIAGSISGADETTCEVVNVNSLEIDEWPKADLVIVIPPIHHHYKQNLAMAYQWAQRTKECLRRNGNVFVIGASNEILRASSAMREVGLDDQTTIIWERTGESWNQAGFYVEQHELILWGGTLNLSDAGVDSTLRSIWRHPPTNQYDYPTEKPAEILEQIIDMATEPGDMIVDPFAGCGDVAAVARKLRRNYWGAEPEGEWYDIARQRAGGPI